MKIRIEAFNENIIHDLLEREKINAGTEIEIQGIGKLVYDGKVIRQGVLPGLPEIFNFTLAFVSGVASSLIANWLYNKLKNNKIQNLIIEQEIIEINIKSIKNKVEVIKLKQ